MGILERASRIVRANLNELLDDAEDPEKLLDQQLIDMQDSLREAKQQVVAVAGQQKQVGMRLASAKAEAERWYGRAADALRANDEELARRAMATKLGIDREVTELERQAQVHEEYTRTLNASLKALESRLTEAKERRKQLAKDLIRHHERERKARRAAGRVRDSSAVTDASAFDDFDRIADGVELAEFETEAVRELNADLFDAEQADLERRFAELERSREAEDGLAALKRQLDGED